MGLLFQWLGVTRASNPFVPMQSYVLFSVYIDEINPPAANQVHKPSSSAGYRATRASGSNTPVKMGVPPLP